MRQRKNDAHLDDVLRANSSDLLAYFGRRVPIPADAADLLSELMIVAWKRQGSIPTDDQDARMWMFGIARNVLNGQRRSVSRRSALAGRLIDELSVDIPAVDDAEAAEVRALIALLDDLDQEIVRCVYWDGFSLAETAQLLGMRPATVRSRHARARDKLRDALGAAD